MDKKDYALIGLGVAVVAIVVAVVVLTITVRIPGRGRIKTVNIGVFADENCTMPVTEIDWGTIPPGGFSQAGIYIKNTGNTPVNVSLATENWDPPECPNYISLSWDLTNMTFSPGEVRYTTLTLTVASNISGITDFCFDIVITGTGS